LFAITGFSSKIISSFEVAPTSSALSELTFKINKLQFVYFLDLSPTSLALASS
jgi:hypothetical protein